MWNHTSLHPSMFVAPSGGTGSVTFVNSYNSSGFNQPVTIPSGLDANFTVVSVAAYYNATGTITLSGFTQEIILGATDGTSTATINALFYAPYSAGTFTPTLGPGVGDYLITAYVFDGVDTSSPIASSDGGAVISLGSGYDALIYDLSATYDNSMIVISNNNWSFAVPDSGITNGTWNVIAGPSAELKSFYRSTNSGAVGTVSLYKAASDIGTAIGLVLNPA